MYYIYVKYSIYGYYMPGEAGHLSYRETNTDFIFIVQIA